jgi:hypothetical protein
MSQPSQQENHHPKHKSEHTQPPPPQSAPFPRQFAQHSKQRPSLPDSNLPPHHSPMRDIATHAQNTQRNAHEQDIAQGRDAQVRDKHVRPQDTTRENGTQRPPKRERTPPILPDQPHVAPPHSPSHQPTPHKASSPSPSIFPPPHPHPQPDFKFFPPAQPPPELPPQPVSPTKKRPSAEEKRPLMLIVEEINGPPAKKVSLNFHSFLCF